MLPEQVGKGFVRQFLKGPHPVARKLGLSSVSSSKAINLRNCNLLRASG